MKTVLSIIGFLALITIGYFAYNNGSGVGVEKFNKTHEKLKEQIDSLKRMQIILRKNQDTMKENQAEMKEKQNELLGNQDSLKKGQEAIFNHITERSEQPGKSDGSYFENLLKFFE